jgi:hypothetical protein
MGGWKVVVGQHGQASWCAKKCSAHLVGEGPDVCGDGGIAGLDVPRPMLTTSRCFPGTMTVPMREFSQAR